jgi:hypothetical protein
MASVIDAGELNVREMILTRRIQSIGTETCPGATWPTIDYVDWHAMEPRPQRWEEGEEPPQAWHVHKHVLSQDRLHRAVMLYEAKLQTYMRALWHCLFLNDHRSAQNARCFRHGNFYCPAICPLLCFITQTSLLLRPFINEREWMICLVFTLLNFGRNAD